LITNSHAQNQITDNAYKFIQISTRLRNLCFAISARKTKNNIWPQRKNTKNEENYITEIFITLILRQIALG